MRIQLAAGHARLGITMLAATTLVISTGVAADAIASAVSKSGQASAAACDPGTQVRTASGPVCGIVAGGDREWLGVPYAAPPVGDLRWAPPQPHAKWTTTLQTTAFGSECAQGGSRDVFLPMQGSEDCLFLNIWRPPGHIPKSGLPVMFHIHGGGLRVGSGNGDYTLLANSGHEVIVSINYRLGIFGFLANAALGAHPGDYGLQDQQAALRWVRANIRGFGGDPRNITVFGESGGGSSVCDLIASPTAAGLFQKAISTSGEYGGLFGVPGPADPLEAQDCKAALPTQARAEHLGASFATAVGCGSATDVAACLRQVPASVAGTVAGSGFQYGGQGTIGPTINGKTLTMTLRQALVRGAVNRVPVIAGVGRDENLIAYPTSASGYRQQVHEQYGKFAPQVLALYPLSRFYSPFVAFRTVVADSDVVCPALVTDRGLARFMPVYGYEIDWGDVPAPSFAGPAGQPNGSAHVAGWYLTPVAGLDANVQVLQTQEVSAVTTFARTGNPTALYTPTWQKFNTSRAVMSLAPGADSQMMTTAQITLNHNCRFWDRISPKPYRH